MVTLGEAIKLTQIREKEVVWLRQKGKRACGLASESIPFLLSDVRKRFDFKKVMVHNINRHLGFDEYGGFEFVVTGVRFDEIAEVHS